MEKERWITFNGESIVSIHATVEQAIIREKQAGHRLKLYIGTDSQVKGSSTEFATVIVFLREKKGGFMFIRKEKTEKPMSLKERMLLEVAKSIEVAYSLCDMLDYHQVGLEIHADINTDPQFRSNTALNDAMGYILSMGFAFKAKPEAFASSACADKFV